jgi:hypothetical protein
MDRARRKPSFGVMTAFLQQLEAKPAPIDPAAMDQSVPRSQPPSPRSAFMICLADMSDNRHEILQSTQITDPGRRRKAKSQIEERVVRS